MKILLVNSEPEIYSGVRRYAINLYTHLKGKCSVIPLFLESSRWPIINKPVFWHRVKREIDKKYDAIHFLNQNLSFLSRKDNTIVTCHDVYYLKYPEDPLVTLRKKFTYSGLKDFPLIIVDSIFIKNELTKFFYIPEEKIRVIYLGVDSKIFRPFNKTESRKKLELPQEARLILHVGGGKGRKNIPFLMEVFSLLSERIKPIFLLRVGKKGKLEENILDKIGLKDKVLYFEEVSEKKLPLFYNASDLFIFPSIHEGFGLPCIESMACGLPTMVSNQGALPEIVVSGGMVEGIDSPFLFAKRAYGILTNTSLTLELREKGIERANAFSWEKTADETLAVYKEILRNLK